MIAFSNQILIGFPMGLIYQQSVIMRFALKTQSCLEKYMTTRLMTLKRCIRRKKYSHRTVKKGIYLTIRDLIAQELYGFPIRWEPRMRIHTLLRNSKLMNFIWLAVHEVISGDSKLKLMAIRYHRGIREKVNNSRKLNAFLSSLWECRGGGVNMKECEN